MPTIRIIVLHIELIYIFLLWKGELWDFLLTAEYGTVRLERIES